jgi:hypothetical protein
MIIANGQDCFDIALQMTGHIESVFKVAELLGLGITDKMPVGVQVLAVDAPLDKRVLRVYKERGIAPASNLNSDLIGVDYWSLELEFIVT